MQQQHLNHTCCYRQPFDCIYLASISIRLQHAIHARSRASPHVTLALRCRVLRCVAAPDPLWTRLKINNLWNVVTMTYTGRPFYLLQRSSAVACIWLASVNISTSRKRGGCFRRMNFHCMCHCRLSASLQLAQQGSRHCYLISWEMTRDHYKNRMADVTAIRGLQAIGEQDFLRETSLD